MGRQKLRMRDVLRRDTEVAEVVQGMAKVKNERRGEERHGGGRGCGGGQQKLRMRDVVRRDTEVAEVVEGTAKVKNERHVEERHGGGRGCGGDDKS